MPFFPLRKIKRNGKYVLFAALLVVVGLAAYLEYVATNTWNNVGKLELLCCEIIQSTPHTLSLSSPSAAKRR